MRGLPFPTNALLDHGPPSEHGTPFSNVDDIPIDPALADPSAVDPAIPRPAPPHALGTPQLHPIVVQDDFALSRPPHFPQEPLRYDQGPQGDPFAPQPPAAYLPIPENEAPRVLKPQRRRRKPRREEECGFCQGNDSKNKLGELEVMVSCEVCGRSGHPSCMELAKVAQVVRSYPWKCIECKICEICQEKGDDARILFCDFCDRGWHMDCLQPPLKEEPPGQWHCPLCPPLGMLPLDPALPHHNTLPPGLDYTTGKPIPDGPTNDAQEANPRVDVQLGDSSTEESSNSDSDSTANAPVVRRPESVKKKRPPRRTTDALTPRPAKRMRIKVRSPPAPLIVRLRLPPKGKGKEREEDTEHNVFEDILSPAERDTSKTNIDGFDRTRFEKSRLAAEEKLYPTPIPTPSAAENPDTPIAGPSSRPLRSTTLHQLSIPPSAPPISPVPSTPSLVPPTPGTFPQTPNTPTIPDGQSTLRIRIIRFGPYDIHPWYDAPFPEEYANIPDGRLWICEFCLKYMRSRFAFGRHRMKCKARHPPGDEIYRDGSVSIFEVDGRKNKIYCQNLCLLSKMFLDHKSLFYDVEPFLFYVITEIDDIGAHFVGYFSKEKCSPKQYNVSCIMTLPVRQRQGWGNFLIDFSYLLSKKEQRAGSPEKPLSGLGALGYKNYWTLALMRYLRSAPSKPTLEDISKATSMTTEDIFTVLAQQDTIAVDTDFLNVARPSPGQSIKFPRGRKNGIARKHLQRPNPQKQTEGVGNKSNAPFVAPTHYEISWSQDKVEQWLVAWEKKGYLTLKPEKLKWTPFVLSRTKAGAEVLQTEPGLGFSAVDRTDTPQSPMDGGTPTLDTSDRAKSLGSGRSLSNEEMVVRDVAEVTAAHLFDDLLRDRTTTPKRQLRNKRRDTSPDSLAMSTRSASARVVLEGDLESHEDSDALPDGTIIPVKRRRSRPTRGRLPDQAPAESQSFPTEPGLTSLSKLTPPRKRRKLDDSPSPENLRGHEDLACTERDDGRPLVVNGEAHAMNGVHPSSPRPLLDAGLAIEAHEGEKGSEQRDGLGDGFVQQECTDVKSEDLGTPLTGLTSHSVPSDDTVIVVEVVNGSVARSKISGEREGASPRGTGEGAVEEDAALRLVVEEDSDLDAEGEPDDEI